MRIEQMRRLGSQQLTGFSDAPDLDARWLLIHVLGAKDTSYLLTHTDEIVPSEQEQEFFRLIALRRAGKPLPYIVGYTEFFGRRFWVTEDVLVPRPLTEELVMVAIKNVHRFSESLGRPLIVADIGCGSGCIAITLALESQAIEHIYASDISPAALAVARRNVEDYKLQDRITLLEGDMLSPLADKDIDIIVSNPPYVPSAELEAPATKETIGLTFEPRGALDGGPDGQKYIEQIKSSGITAVVEVTGGKIAVFNTQAGKN